MQLQADPDFNRHIRQLLRVLTKIDRRLNPEAESDSISIPPTFVIDQMIIANARLTILQEAGLVAGERGIDLPPFECERRGYLVRVDQHGESGLASSVVVTLIGEAAEDEDVVQAIVETLEYDEEDIFEYWLLEDDEVVDYWEWGDEDAAAAAAGSGLLDGLIFCADDDLPMVNIDGNYVCSGEYLAARLGDSVVTDIVSTPDQLALVFSNGCVLPLICPHCGQPVHTTDEDSFLEAATGLSLATVGWDPEDEALLLGFSTGQHNGFVEGRMIAVHLDSVVRLT